MSRYDQVTDHAFTLTKFLSPAECRAYVELAESLGFTDAPINTPGGPMLRQDVRNNTRVMLDDEERSAELWERIRHYVSHAVRDWTACGLNERLRFYRYDVGQQFDWHYDGAFERADGERSQLTFMVYLNDDFEGGETTLGDVDVKPARGMALVFVHQVLHKGQPVARGRKYVVRTDVMYRKTFHPG